MRIPLTRLIWPKRKTRTPGPQDIPDQRTADMVVKAAPRAALALDILNTAGRDQQSGDLVPELPAVKPVPHPQPPTDPGPDFFSKTTAVDVAAQPEPATAIGWVDHWVAPDRINGWAVIPSHPGLPVTVIASLRGRLIGQVVCQFPRPDVGDAGTRTSGFALHTKAPLDWAAWATNAIVVSVFTPGGAIPLAISEDLIAAARLIESARTLMSIREWSDDRLHAVCTRCVRDGDLEPDERDRMFAMLELARRGTELTTYHRLAERLLSACSVTGERPDADIAAADSPSAIMGAFESLGCNCEFGIAQRHYGCEPLSLLRWASVPIDSIMACLRTDFAGVGSPEFTEFGPFWGKEYGTCDRRYELKSHTFTTESQIRDYDKEFAKHCRRITWLRDLTLSRLHEHDRIFVFYYHTRLSDQQIADLFTEISRFGPNTLFCVRQEEPGRPNGTVEVLQQHLLVGYIDAFAPIESVNDGTQFESWLNLCRKARQLADAWVNWSAG
jgi:hypothetical protein